MARYLGPCVTRMRRVTIFVSLLIAVIGVGCGGQSRSKAPDSLLQEQRFVVSEAQPPRTYISKSGVILTVIYLKEEPGKPLSALATFVGVQHPLAAKVFQLTQSSQADGVDTIWNTRYDGREWAVLQISNLNMQMTFSPPRTGMVLPVQFDKASSEAIDVDRLIAKHRAQKELLGTISSVDRNGHIQIVKSQLRNILATSKKDCGIDFPVEFDWDSFSDKDFSDSKHGKNTVMILSQLCRRSVQSRQSVVDKVKAIHYRVGEQNSSRLDPDGTLQVQSQSGVKRKNYQKRRAEIFAILKLDRVVAADATGAIVVFDPDRKDPRAYIGDGKIFRQLMTNRTGAFLNIDSDFSIWRKGDVWLAPCDKKPRVFTELSVAKAKKILATASFEGPIWKRSEVSLSRDERGVYYYVDRASDALGGKDYRVYKGLRGQLQKTKLIDIVDDGNGLIFSTQQGQLRLIIGETGAEALWLNGKKRDVLTVIESSFSRRELIYHGLGLYDGVELGTMCD